MKIRVELEKEELDAIATLATMDCPCLEVIPLTCKACPLYISKSYICLHQVAKQVQYNCKCELNSMYGNLVTVYADTDSTGEQTHAQSSD